MSKQEEQQSQPQEENIVEAKPRPLNHSKSSKPRKSRLTQDEIIDYIQWSQLPDNKKNIEISSYAYIQKLYKEQTGKDVSVTFVRNQKLKIKK